MPTPTDDLVARLRSRTFRPVADFVQQFNEQGNLTERDAMMHAEAADAIERLRAENEALRAEVNVLRPLALAAAGRR